MALLHRLVPFRRGEGRTAWLMFGYSYLAMSAYNIVKPATRSTFITALGADNLPYVLLGSGVLIGLTMQLYLGAAVRLPRGRVIPVTQLAMAGCLLGFWLLLGTGASWVPVAFYVFGLLLGLLLISQFWTLANDIYDAREARRLFGFIGGGASLGGATGAGFTARALDAFGTVNLLLVGAAVLVCCAAVSAAVIRRHPHGGDTLLAEERGVGAGEAFRLLRESRHLQVIALIIGCAAVGATIVEQQLNMAAAATRDSTDAITLFLAEVAFYVSLAGFVIQVALTGRIHRVFGLVFALLLLPVSLGATAMIILLNGSAWAPAVARVLDTSLRYTIDKTSREVLFLPLPASLKDRSKPLLDVTVDRVARGVAALALLALIKPWGLGWDWQRLSYASLVVMGAWIVFAIVARREYLRAFRRSLDAHDFAPAPVRFDVADASTIQALRDELSKPDEDAVIHAIDMLESIGRLDLVTPLLLHHDAPRVRARTLDTLTRPDAVLSQPWLPTVTRLLDDGEPQVRAAAVRALAALEGHAGAGRLRPYLIDPAPRVAAAVAVALADSPAAADVAAADETLARLAGDLREQSAGGRREAAAALARIGNPAFHALLIPLMHDPVEAVAREAIASVGALGLPDARFVPALVSLLGHRQLKTVARETLVRRGDAVVPPLAHFMRDPLEPIWVRRHVPATLAGIPSRASLEALVAALDDDDGFLRYKAIGAIQALGRRDPALTPPRDVVEARIVAESSRYFVALTLRHNLLASGDAYAGSLLARALSDRLDRTMDRIFRLLGLLHPWRDVAAARYAIDGADARARAGAIEYLDNVLAGPVRKRVMPIIDTTPAAEKVRHANSLLRTRTRDVPDTLAQLVHEEDPVISASAIHAIHAAGLTAAMRDDLAFVRRHHRGGIVTDAVTWALGPPSPDAGGEPRVRPLPVVEVVNRLRAIPLFERVSIDELFRIAQDARQVRLGPGVLYRQGEPAEEVCLLVGGSVRLAGAGLADAVVAAPAALNLADSLEGRPLRHTVTAGETVPGVVLASTTLLTILTDNVATAEGVFRMLLRSPAALDWMLDDRADARLDARPVPEAIDAVETATRLRRIALFSRATVDQLQALTAAAVPVPLDPGDVLWDDGREPAIYHVLLGEITLSTTSAPDRVAGAGGTVGVAETLTGSSPGRRAAVTREGRALRLGREALFDVLADHGDLLQDVFARVLERGGDA